jgi:dGTPase
LAALPHLRFPLEQARGRRYPELPHPYRNQFQRDRDRIVHARAFRRLENKTQVFASSLSDHFRNRLTHTIEVSQIARTVALALGLDEDLTEALALAHDIGHPPFAHAGEEELDQMMQRFGERFEHNRHALRIVESFENAYARFPGLNLTFEVREGIVKHSRDFEAGEFPDLEEYLPGLKPPLEAQLIDLCDEIAYNTADLDDGYSAGLVLPAEAARAVSKFGELWDAAEMQFPGAPEAVKLKEVVRGLINWLVTGLILGTVAAAEGLAGLPQGLTGLDAVRRHARRVAQFSAETAAGTEELKRFLRERVYYSDAVLRSRSETAGRIAALFQFFLDHPERLHAAHREDSFAEPLHRRVCDYIAGMTDGFFLKTCQQMGVA